MKCPKCSFENPSETRFCGNCAAPLHPEEKPFFPPTETFRIQDKELTTGSVFAGRYQVIEELGKGGMGKVYRVLDKKINEEIALKLVKPEIASDRETIERFGNELRMARKISHRHVARMYHLSEEMGTHYITMEYVPGEDLKSLIKKIGQLPTGKAIFIAKQVCEGLAEAHRLGVVHRDLKPSNVMIDKDGNTRILDFGIARSVKTKGLTGAGVMIGTPEYMSPEQSEAKEVDHRSDIYSLGVIFYEMATGRVPFEGETPLSVAMKHKTEAPRDPRDFSPQLPESFTRVILRCLEKDREKRYQSAEELLSELNSVEKELPSTKKVLLREKELKRPRMRFQSLLVPGIALLAVILIGAGYFFLSRISEKAKPEATFEKETRKMIVILPFENLGPAEDEYFAAGITEEITSRLSSVRELGVISGTSALQYDRKGKTMKQIGKDLGADFVLEGTVRWDKGVGAKGRVRITPQLIRASDDTHLWSERYERVIDDIFAIQSEVAEQVIEQLDLTLLEKEKQGLKAKPTENIEAYQAYLRGLDYMGRVGYSADDSRLAIEMFELAVELDPKFALAYIQLSQAYSLTYHYGYDRTADCQSKAKAAADRAFELQPDLPEAHLALGYYYYWCFKDYDQALKEFSIAEKGLPNEISILEALGYIQRRQGKFQEAAEKIKAAFQLNPQNASLAYELGLTYLYLRKHAEADDYLSRSISLFPDQAVAYSFKAMNHWAWEGSIEKARAVLEKMPKTDAFSIYICFLQKCMERNYQAALDWINSSPIDPLEFTTFVSPKSLLAGMAYQLLKQPEPAWFSFDSARSFLENELKKRPDDPRLHSSLGITYAGLGRKEEAVREGQLAVKLYPISRDVFFGANYLEGLAHIYLMVGEYDKAVDTIEELLSIPHWYSSQTLRIDPRLDELRNHPKFKRLLEKKQ